MFYFSFWGPGSIDFLVSIFSMWRSVATEGEERSTLSLLLTDWSKVMRCGVSEL